jgi:hypothetical protein
VAGGGIVDCGYDVVVIGTVLFTIARHILPTVTDGQ